MTETAREIAGRFFSDTNPRFALLVLHIEEAIRAAPRLLSGDELRDALHAAAPPPQPEPGWQDISTAPKDGTDFLATYMWMGRPVYRIAGWRNECWCTRPGEWRIEPTHWRPLPPAPPKETKP